MREIAGAWVAAPTPAEVGVQAGVMADMFRASLAYLMRARRDEGRNERAAPVSSRGG